VALYRKLHPYYDMKAHPERGTVLFQHDENTVFSPEELLSMVLQHAKQMAEDFTQQKVSTHVGFESAICLLLILSINSVPTCLFIYVCISALRLRM
jgi:hypothetical protein